MLNNFDEINLLYNGIFLNKIKLDKSYTIHEIEDNLPKGIIKNYNLSIVSNNYNTTLEYDILHSYLLNYTFFNIDLNSVMKEPSKQIIKYIEILEFISDSNFSDSIVKTKNRKFFISYASIIAQRNLEIIKILFKELVNNDNQLVVKFLLRDIIENIKLYLYFIRGAVKEEEIKNNQGTLKKEIISKEIQDKILQVLSTENTDWDFNIKQIIDDNPSLKLWNDDLKRIQEINYNCNSIIHKLGLTKLLPVTIMNSKDKISISDVCFCIRFFITLIICYDGKEISSSDYVDYLDMDMEPPENSQYWVAPIIQNFIDSEYILKEKNILKEMSYMDIH
ncbi:MAG: hypothetical protein IJ542_01210 [Clostridia bacterium]|nr:hypothetical protein [Clostridia bacterium]